MSELLQAQTILKLEIVIRYRDRILLDMIPDHIIEID
jgi:hypothetical protein